MNLFAYSCLNVLMLYILISLIDYDSNILLLFVIPTKAVECALIDLCLTKFFFSSKYTLIAPVFNPISMYLSKITSMQRISPLKSSICVLGLSVCVCYTDITSSRLPALMM